MKCKHCPALRQDGYEYPEEYCALGVQDNETIEDSEGNLGCRRRSAEKVKRDLEAQDNIEAEAYAEFAQGMIEIMDRAEGNINV